MRLKCECGGELVTLEMFCTDPYQAKTVKEGQKLAKTHTNPEQDLPLEEVEFELAWFRDIKKRCVCSRCFREQDIVVDTVKQDKRFK